MADIVCKSKGAAIAALDTIAGVMPAGIQRDALLAVKKWLNENVRSGAADAISDETLEKLRKAFGGDDHDRLAREWLGRVRKGGNVPEPPHGARVHCLWNGKAKKWEPEHLPPSGLPRTDREGVLSA